MSSNEYGTLGKDMKAMKDDRKNFMAQTKVQDKKLKAETHQFLADADKMMTGIAKDVAGLKAEARQMLAEADKFMADTSRANAKLRTQTHQTLAPVKADLDAQHRQLANDAGKMMAGVRKDINVLKAEAGQVVADAASMINGLAKASRERSAAWRDVLRTVRGNGQAAPARASTATAVMERPAKTKSKAMKRAPAKKR